MQSDLAKSDEKYLRERKPNATEEDVAQFIERVAVCIEDGRLSEDKAREVALRGIEDA